MTQRDRPVRYEVVARTDNDLYWSAHLHCGLADLVADRVIRLRFAPRLAWAPADYLCSVLEVTDTASGRRRTLAFDWRDNPDRFAVDKLAECDVYFKRNLIPSVTIPLCPPEHRGKLRPAGLSFAMRPSRLPPLWVQWIGGLWSRARPLRQPTLRETLTNLHAALVRHPRSFRSLLPAAAFERTSLGDAANRISFRTRAYDPVGSAYPEDTAEVTAERAAIIRALREEFGSAFVGGFIPTPYAKAAYPDCLAPVETQQSYATVLHACRIAVYTRGLRDSPAYKLGEYLAGARCIVAQRMKTQLPRPLRDGADVAVADGVEGIVRACRELLDDLARQDALSAGAHAYYRDQVQPRQRVLAMLREAFEGAVDPRPEGRGAAGPVVEGALAAP